MRVLSSVVVVVLFFAAVHAQLYYMNGQGLPAADPYSSSAINSYSRAYNKLASQLADPLGYIGRFGHPLVHYVHPAALQQLHDAARMNPYYYHQYHSYANPASAWYQQQFTAGLPHIAGVDVAPVVSASGDASRDAARRITEALSVSGLERAAAESGLKAQQQQQQEGGEDEHPKMPEVETREIPRCFVCDRNEEECRLECKTEDSVSSGYNGYQFDAPKFVGERWFREKTGVTSIPRVTPETTREFCTVRVGGSGSFHAVFFKAFHVEFCLMSRLIKRPDFLTKFNAVQEHAFRRAIDLACHDKRYAELCLPPRLEDSACLGNCEKCQAIVTTALNAATGGDAFDCAAFHKVTAEQLKALGLERNKRSIDALAFRARQLYSVSTGLTGRSDRDKLVISENLCASFGKPSCSCTKQQVDADGAGKQVHADDKSGAGGDNHHSEGDFIVGEGEHVSTDALQVTEEANGGAASSDTLEAAADNKKNKVETLKEKAQELKTEIAHEENQEKELEVAAKDAAHQEQGAVAQAQAQQTTDNASGSGSSQGSDSHSSASSGSDEDHGSGSH